MLNVTRNTFLFDKRLIAFETIQKLFGPKTADLHSSVLSSSRDDGMQPDAVWTSRFPATHIKSECVHEQPSFIQEQ